MAIVVRPLTKLDWASVSNIYADGIATGIATFETHVPNWNIWDKKYIKTCRLVAISKNTIIGFALLSPVSAREVYKGVAEVSIYIQKDYRGRQIGELVLNELILESEINGFWTLQANIFSENQASINLFKKCGFRVVGIREKIGMLHEKWHDNYLMERRRKINRDT